MLQEPILFRTSVADNIACGATLEISADRIREAARQAGAEEFILALPQGYDTVLAEEGLSLSGGQRQRLGLARALARDTPILILDEPTSSLDVETESIVWRNVEALLRRKTAIVIAHRLSTARVADRIVILEEGAIAEAGTHEELLARGGLYAKLWRRQSASQADTDALLAERD
jgi:ABC-type multidrug transport system fused ATPase/permease subunit